MRHLRLLLSLLLLAACNGGGGGNGSPTEPNDPLTGSWRGTWSGTDFTTGESWSNQDLSLSLVQTGSVVTGTGIACDPGGCASGTVNGTTSGNGIVITATPSEQGRCPYRATGTWSAVRIYGDWVTFNCTHSIGGSFDVGKQ